MATQTLDQALEHLRPRLKKSEQLLMAVKLRKADLRAEHVKLDIVAREIVDVMKAGDAAEA